MATFNAVMLFFVALGLQLVLPFLIAALIRGGLRGRRDRAARRREISEFD